MRSNDASRPVSGKLIDWSMAFINVSNDPERIQLGLAPKKLVRALRGTDALPLHCSDHLPHAIVIKLDAKAKEMKARGQQTIDQTFKPVPGRGRKSRVPRR